MSQYESVPVVFPELSRIHLKIPASSFAELAIIASSLLSRRCFISVLFDT